MSNRFCVAVSALGGFSQTFVRRHIEDLLPGETCVVTVGKVPPAERGWDVDVPTFAFTDHNGPLEMFRRRVMRNLDRTIPKGLGEHWEYSAADSRRLVRFLKDQGVEAILVEFADFLLPYIRPVREAGIRWYTFGHGYDVSQNLLVPWWRERYKLLGEANGVFVRADRIRNRFASTVGLDPAKVHTVYGGIDVPDEPPPARAAGPTVELLAVGRMVPKKAPLLLLEAFERAWKQAPSLRLKYVGAGELFESAKEYVQAHELFDVVTLYGATPSSFVAERLTEIDLFVQHSIRDPQTGDEEGLPAAITEAMGLALPVVSTIHAGIPDAVRDGVNGFLVPEGDVQGMADRIVQLARDPELRRRHGLEGYRIAKERFTWEGERERILDLTGLR